MCVCVLRAKEEGTCARLTSLLGLVVAVTTKCMSCFTSWSLLMTASLPTPLGPEITMRRGLGLGKVGFRLKVLPSFFSKAAIITVSVAVSL